MLRQRPARRLTPLERRDRDLRACRRIHCHPRRSLGLRCILLQVGKTQFELLEHGTAFRGLPVSLVLELGDRELHLLDQQLADADFGLGIARFRLRFQACDPRCDHHRLERRDIVGQRISCGRHKAIAPQIANLARSNHVLIHNVALNPPPAVATSAVAAANQSLPANIPAAPA